MNRVAARALVAVHRLSCPIHAASSKPTMSTVPSSAPSAAPSAVPSAVPSCEATKSKYREGRRPQQPPAAAPGPSYVLKTPKGTSDFGPAEMAVRNEMFRTIRQEFELHGAVEIDTPVFETREILTGKYGDDGAKLIYDLADQGGEPCSLRYDLTVPFARYVAMHRLRAFKRFHIAKVYRRDQPAVAKGRRREFFQCDFDIAGAYDAMVPDAEVLALLARILSALRVGRFAIKINHRALLLAAIAAGAPAARHDCLLFRAVSSAVDKLDKLPWSDVRDEIIAKGVSAEGADRIAALILDKKPSDCTAEPCPYDLFAAVEEAARDDAFSSDPAAKAALNEMRALFTYTRALGVPKDVLKFDLSLARGLDYYTGVIFEAVLLDEPTTAELRESAAAAAAATAATVSAVQSTATTPAPESRKSKSKKSSKTDSSNSSANPCDNGAADAEADADAEAEAIGVGSIAAGGRYDGLVGMFVGTSRKGADNAVPCVGVSIGVERIFSILMRKQRSQTDDAVKHVPTQVLVMSVGGALLEERMTLCAELRAAGFASEYVYKRRPKLQPQFDICDRDVIPLAVIIGPEEIEQGIVKIKDMRTKTEGENSGGTPVQRDMMLEEIRLRLEKI